MRKLKKKENKYKIYNKNIYKKCYAVRNGKK